MKILSTYLQGFGGFFCSPKQTKVNYPQFIKPEALVVLQQHYMFHRTHHRMCS